MRTFQTVSLWITHLVATCYSRSYILHLPTRRRHDIESGKNVHLPSVRTAVDGEDDGEDEGENNGSEGVNVVSKKESDLRDEEASHSTSWSKPASLTSP